MEQEEYYSQLREDHKKMLLTKEVTAEELSVSEATLDRLRKNGDIESKKVLGRVMFSIDEVARFLADA